MRYDALQIWMLTIAFVAPVLIGASSGEFMKAVALAEIGRASCRERVFGYV